MIILDKRMNAILFFNYFLKIYKYKLLGETLFHNIWISDVNCYLISCGKICT